MLIRIARQVRVTFSNTELQMLRPGEFYDVPPAVGRVLVSEGWAVEPGSDTMDSTADHLASANDAPPPRRSS